MNHKWVERIWRREGLKVPKKQPKRGKPWPDDRSFIRLPRRWKNHVWAYDYFATGTHDGKPISMLTVIDEYSRECLATEMTRHLNVDTCG